MEGNLIPSAKQISDRAGVNMRSVFRHFDDMETLHSMFDQLIDEELHGVRSAPADPRNVAQKRQQSRILEGGLAPRMATGNSRIAVATPIVAG